MGYVSFDWLLMMIGGSMVAGTLAIFGLMVFMFLKAIVGKQHVKFDERMETTFRLFMGLISIDVGFCLAASHYGLLGPIMTHVFG